MKLFAPLVSWRRQAAQRLPRTRSSIRRYTSNTSKPNAATDQGKSAVDKGQPPITANTVTSVRAATPGTVRVRRGTDPRAQGLEMDTTITRMMGSDWGDRSKQPVTFAMKLYWGIFILVLANGAFTYFVGKDETFLVDKVQKKVDEKLGRVETNEFVIMADKPNTSSPASTAPDADVPSSTSTPTPTPTPTLKSNTAGSKSAPTPMEGKIFESAETPTKSVFASKTAPTPMPFFGAPTAQRVSSKGDYERQLQQLRLRQSRAREERNDPSGFRSVEEIDVEIKRIDQHKAHVKRMLKQL